MLRRLLACLALISGLAATGAPAQADVVAMASQVESSVSGAIATQGQVASAISQPLLLGAFAPAEVSPLAAVPLRAAPSVRLRSDRSRE